MNTFKVCGLVTVSCWTLVEAENMQEAIEIAQSRDLAEHHIDGSYEEDECWHFDNDGTPDQVYCYGNE